MVDSNRIAPAEPSCAQAVERLGWVADIAHDLINLLLAIAFNLEALAEAVPESPAAAPLLDGARQALDRAHSLVTHLLVETQPPPDNEGSASAA